MPSANAKISPPLHLGLVLFPGCMPAGLFVTADLVRACNLRLGTDIVRTTWIGADLQSMRTHHGPSLQPEQTIAGAGCDALLLPGLWAASAGQLQAELAAQRPLVRALGALPNRTRLWSYCAGVPLVAATGRLTGQPATATWWLQGALGRLFPEVAWQFDDDLVRGRHVTTAAGPHGYLALMLDVMARLMPASALRDVQDVLMLHRPPTRLAVFRAVDAMNLPDASMQTLLSVARLTPASELTLQRAASGLHVTVRTLCRRVRAATGLAAGDWLRRVKLRQASDALTRTRAPIKRIADDLGYASESSLHRSFRALTGLTPTGYRQTYAGDAELGR